MILGVLVAGGVGVALGAFMGYRWGRKDTQEVFEKYVEQFRGKPALADVKDIHDYHCGCPSPGNAHTCVALPRSAFVALGEELIRVNRDLSVGRMIEP